MNFLPETLLTPQAILPIVLIITTILFRTWEKDENDSVIKLYKYVFFACLAVLVVINALIVFQTPVMGPLFVFYKYLRPIALIVAFCGFVLIYVSRKRLTHSINEEYQKDKEKKNKK